MTEEKQLYAKLKKTQERQGYFLNPNRAKTMDLLRGLLINRERYGYMSCPCRLAAGDRASDGDLVCPCVYRKADVREFGSCYCGLYVSKDWNEDTADQVYVPDRRPPEKIL